MQTIKCALCGAEWIGKQSIWTHPENDCPLAGICTYRPIVLAVNKAIHAAIMQRVALGEIKVFPKALTGEEIKRL